MPLLEIDDLAVAFGPPREPPTVVDGVTFSIDARETVALVGESGSGQASRRWRSCGCCRSPAG